jgi:hypothetical protein
MPRPHDKARFTPLGARLSGGVDLSGTVYDWARAPVGGAVVFASVMTKSDRDGDWYELSMTESEADGSFAMEVSPGIDTAVSVFPGPDDRYFSRADEPWSRGGSYTGRDFWPGRLPVTAHRGGPWRDFTRIVVGLRSETAYSDDSFATIGTKTTPVDGLVEMLDGAYVKGYARFFRDEGLEFEGAWDVTPGATSATGLTLHEAEAQRIWITTPYWHSGRPGATVELAFHNFPAGWVNWMRYTSEGPVAVAGSYGALTSAGAHTHTAFFEVPADAPPGYTCWISAQHDNGLALLELSEAYQVCTLVPSKKSIRRGQRIRVTGVVPTEGRIYDIVPGLRKTVTLYAHEGNAPVPTQWDPSGAGWVEVCTARTDGFGAYKTPYFTPSRTETLVVRYPGDNEYFDAYTSAVRIVVRR